MPAFHTDLAFGKEAEARIAATVVEALYPNGVAIRWPETALVDFVIVQHKVVVAALEVKRRRVPSTQFEDTILPEAIVATGVELTERLKIPLLAAIAFSDNTLVVFRVTPQPKTRMVLDRAGKPVPHHCFPLNGDGVIRLKTDFSTSL